MQDSEPEPELIEGLPALGYVHDEAYFGRLFWHFLDMLELREMEDHLAEMVPADEPVSAPLTPTT